MSNWKIIGKIAAGFGIIFVVFSVFSAVLTYSLANIQEGYYPLSYILISVFSSMLNPYLLLAALSFVVAWFAMHTDAESESPPVMDEEETKAPAEVQPEEAKP